MKRYILDLKLYWKYIKKYTKGHYITLFIAFVTLIIGTLLQLPAPFFFKKIIDEVIPTGNYKTLLLYGILITFIIILRETSSFLTRTLSLKMRNSIDEKLRVDLLRTYYSLPYNYIISNSPGYFVSRIFDEPYEFEEVLINTSMHLGKSILILIFGIIACFTLSVKLTLITALFIPVFQGLNSLYGKIIKPKIKHIREKEAKLKGYLNEYLLAYKIIKIFNAASMSINSFRSHLREFLKKNAEQIRLSWGFSLLYNSLSDLIPVIIVTLGAMEIIRGNLTIGSLIAFLSLANYIIMPVQNISEIIIEIENAIALMERMEELLTIPSPYKGGITINRIHSLKIHSLSISIRGRKLIDRLDLDIKPGDRVLILGENGSGKTTLLHALHGFIENKEGEICINNISFNRINKDSFLRYVSSSFQPPQLLPGGLKENLFISKKQFNRKHINYLFEKFKLKKRFNLLEESIEWGGINLSDGEKQKIQIIRTLLKDAGIYIFDEPLSNIDEPSKEAILDEIFKRTKNKILIMTLHGNERFYNHFNKIIYLGKKIQEVYK